MWAPIFCWGLFLFECWDPLERELRGDVLKSETGKIRRRRRRRDSWRTKHLTRRVFHLLGLLFDCSDTMAFQFGGTFCAKWFLFLSYPAVTDGLLTGAGETFFEFCQTPKGAGWQLGISITARRRRRTTRQWTLMVSFVSLEVEDEREKRDNPLLGRAKSPKVNYFGWGVKKNQSE